jgi:endonuclease V-like protein UPF0215 family
MPALSNVIGFDDGPFEKEGPARNVLLVGAVFARTRLDGVVAGHIRRDGCNATQRMIELVRGSQFDRHVRAVLLGGIAVGGFNVVDIHRLARELERPVLVVARRQPRLAKIHAALAHVGSSEAKWRLIEQAGAMERLGDLYVQRAGLTLDEARLMLQVTTLHGALPEPLRVAHLIAGGITTGHSRGRA